MPTTAAPSGPAAATPQPAPAHEPLPKLTRADGEPIRALVVDDEPELADLMRRGLEMTGWEVRTANDGFAALRTAREFVPDVLVLDVMMPGMDGVELLQKLRTIYPDVPALFLTAKDAVTDKVTGLAAGGDDYVTKPFSMKEVLLRLHRVVQRSGITAPQFALLQVGDLTLNKDTKVVQRDGTDIPLTGTEFELLKFLMENPRHVLSKSRLLDRVWNYDFGGQSNIVELYISYLRKKVDAGRPPMIHTVRGSGYVIKPAP
ncbi:two-component system OmpR family response regulator [Arthrobacter stackebrandtii]|uniref:Two-component system OmpR family response regulator n=1 Tax=Arthrobacter stackebrandtii TaxID=272161 RepID=A0ABS4YTQ4_9MICC|nr:response regulator transcription factor [Arthrobacter stackebrandtii]MBP2412156.1 two-component system OmpR family response regulator [Arthrobacter stackebrandtii]PYH01951.1 DNA-binding response regulator [Arthrobacter stackebrandtii]